jgi:hypothetical protein
MPASPVLATPVARMGKGAGGLGPPRWLSGYGEKERLHLRHAVAKMSGPNKVLLRDLRSGVNAPHGYKRILRRKAVFIAEYRAGIRSSRDRPMRLELVY